MNVDEAFQAPELCTELLAGIRRLAASSALARKQLAFMEVCGTHTVAIFRSGLRSLLPENISLLSGPGCPVCVTPGAHIDLCVQAARQPGLILASFGDMLRVPGPNGSLAEARARGAGRVAMVYSPINALELAEAMPETQVVFAAVGFETTAPAIAATVLAAASRGVRNFSIIPLGKTMPAVLDYLLRDGPRLSGLICPGHVSAVTGMDIWQQVARRFHLPCAVTGFETADLLAGILALLKQQAAGVACAVNSYPRVVNEAGNSRAQALARRVFTPCASEWRGLGLIEASGLALREEYRMFDAVSRFGLVAPKETAEPAGCRCGQVLRALIQAPECPLFGRACTPAHPVGPCMVSSEGACAAFFRYAGMARI